MALIKCPVCGQPVSNLAPKCPKCGTPISDTYPFEHYQPTNNARRYATLAVMTVLLIIGLFFAYKHRFFFDRVTGTWKSVWYECEYGTLSLSTLSEWSNRDENYYKDTLTFHSDGTLTKTSNGNAGSTYYWKKEKDKYNIYNDTKQKEPFFVYTIEERDGRTVLVWELMPNQNMVYSQEDIQVEEQIDYNKIAAEQSNDDIPYWASGQGSGTGSTQTPSNDYSSSSSSGLGGSSENSILNDDGDEEDDDYEESGAEENEEYIFPASDTTYLSKSDLKGMTKSQINLAKNELYARHGRMFSREDLQEYFNDCSWYEPEYTPEEWDEYGDSYFFNEYEIANRNLLNKQEKRK